MAFIRYRWPRQPSRRTVGGKKRRAPLSITGLTLAVWASSTAQAQSAEDYKTDAFLLGDPGGVRTDLHDAGIDLTGSLTSELAGNVRGGQRKDVTHVDQWMLAADLNLARMIGIKGGSFKATVIDRNGPSLNDTAGLNTLLNPQEVFGGGTRPRIVEFYYQQQLLNDRVTLKVGRMPESGDIFPFSCQFQNLTFCGTVPGYITPNWYTWPVSQWGFSGHAKIGKQFEVQASIYQVNPTLGLPSNGLDFGNPGDVTGHFAVGEIAWKPTINDRPGTYRVGVWRNTGDFDDVYLDRTRTPIGVTGRAPRVLHQASSYYLMAQPQLTGNRIGPGDTESSLSAFANFIRSDDKVTYIESIVQAGLFWTGPFASRPSDEIGFGIARSTVNTRSARRIRQENAQVANGQAITPIPDEREYAMELYYSLSITHAITTRPNIQYTINPGGVSTNNALVFGLKSLVTF